MSKPTINQNLENRRLLLKFLAGSPLLSLGIPGFSFNSEQQDPIIKKAAEAINVFDFQKAAKAKLPPAHYGYIATGVLDDRTLIENEKAYQRIKLRMRRLNDVDQVDTSVNILGESWNSPLFICPCGSQKAFHPDGEMATAKAAKSEGHQQLLSTVTTTSIEDVSKAKGSPPWFQLYPSIDWEDTVQMIRRAENVGANTLVLTVDMDYSDSRETLSKMAKLDERNCRSCHIPGQPNKNKPMVNKLKNPFDFKTPLTWEFVKQLKDTTNMKLVLKGLVSPEDSRIAIDHGADAIIVSNHGGRASESGRATIDSLTDVLEATNGQIPVMVDGGIRRGKDIFKALARGATAVGIGRPYLWGLGSFGQEGVEMVLRILKEELKLTMQQTGVASINDINESQLIQG